MMVSRFGALAEKNVSWGCWSKPLTQHHYPCRKMFPLLVWQEEYCGKPKWCKRSKHLKETSHEEEPKSACYHTSHSDLVVLQHALGLPLESVVILLILFLLDFFKNGGKCIHKRFVVALLRFLTRLLLFVKSATLLTIFLWFVKDPGGVILTPVVFLAIDNLEIVSTSIDLLGWITIFWRNGFPFTLVVDLGFLSFCFLSLFTFRGSFVLLGSILVRGFKDGFQKFQVCFFDHFDLGCECNNLFLIR